MATKMKAQTTAEFLSGNGVDLGATKKVSGSQDQDDLDILLSEITIQFDDEVQTLYFGPVAIVNDELGSGNCPPKNVVSQKPNPGQSLLKNTTASKHAVSKSSPMRPPPPTAAVSVSLDDVTMSDANVDLAAMAKKQLGHQPQQKRFSTPEVGAAVVGGGVADSAANDDRPHRLTAAAVVIDPKNGVKSQTPPTEDLKKTGRRKLKPSSEKTPPPPAPINNPRVTRSATSPVKSLIKPTAIISPSTKRKSPGEADQQTRTGKRLKVNTEPAVLVAVPIQEEIKQLSPVLPPSTEEEHDKLPCKLEAKSVESVEEKIPGLVSSVPLVEIPLACEKALEPAPISEPIVQPLTLSPGKNDSETCGSSEQLPLVEKSEIEDNKPQTLEVESDQSIASNPIDDQVRIKTPDSEVSTAVIVNGTEGDKTAKGIVIEIEKQEEIPPTDIIEDCNVKKQQEGLITNGEGESLQEEGTEEPKEGELIVPDVLPQGNAEELLALPYDKDSSPAGSDSGIENEGTELVKDKTVPNIPERSDRQQKPEKNTQPKKGKKKAANAQIPGTRVIKCEKCVMLFTRETCYKKHLMNYHGIDLSNIAHFLSNLQTLDEGIPDGEDGQSVGQEYDDFQLENDTLEDDSATDKTDGVGEEAPEQQLGGIEADTIRKLQQPDGGSSTSGPATTSHRRKDKLVPINSEEGLRIKHEYSSTSLSSAASTSGSSQPTLNNMFLVKILEQTGWAPPKGMIGLPDANKENARTSRLMVDPLATEDDAGLTPYERSKIVERVIDDKETFMCNICDKIFEQRQHAMDHVNFTHKDVKRRSCPHCGRTFTQTGDLTRHVRIHTGIRPFKCPFDGCKYAFISSGDMYKHVRRHNQLTNPIPKPHVCSTCGKNFERGYDLKRHNSMHAKDDPNFQGFTCELCGKIFARKDQYRAHTYRHIGYKPHKCTHCDKCFSDASNFAKHLKSHQMDGLALFCAHCEKPFKNKMAISKHVFHCKYKNVKVEPKRKKK